MLETCRNIGLKESDLYNFDNIPFSNFASLDTDPSNVFKKHRETLSRKELNYAISAINSINDNYWESMGVSKEYISLVEKQKELIILQWDTVEKNDTLSQMNINVLEREIEELEKTFTGSEPVSIWETKAMLEQSIGIRLSDNDTTIKEFIYHYKNYLKNGKSDSK